jgi:hypothetical protein
VSPGKVEQLTASVIKKSNDVKSVTQREKEGLLRSKLRENVACLVGYRPGLLYEVTESALGLLHGEK